MDGYIGLGSNLGDRGEHLRGGIDALARAGASAMAQSAVWETEPVGTTEPGWFWNMALRVRTELEPAALLALLQAVELERGRRPAPRNAPRTLDLDLLMLGEHRRADPDLSLPHPRMWERRFVLAPLAEIAPELRDPRSGRSVAQALAALPVAPRVRRLGPLDTLEDSHR